MYALHFPLPHLRPFIECYWFLRTAELPAPLEEIVFTDGRADIVLNYGAPYLRREAGRREAAQTMARSNLDAQRRYPVHIVQQGSIHLIGVRFRPGGLAAFLRLPMRELAGLTLDLHAAFGPAGDELEARLFDQAARREAQLSLLNAFFAQRLAAGDSHRLVARLAGALEASRGRLSVQALGQEAGYSARTLDRLFQQVLGLPPKFYGRTIRFRHTLNSLLRQPGIDWADLVAAHGYYDQPHFIKEFVEFTGTRPEQYRAQLQRNGYHVAPNHVQFLQDMAEQKS